MELDGITVFVKVVQEGSSSQAARMLGMPNSTVSAKVAQLEQRLGVTLLQRTTRKLNVTQAGRLILSAACALSRRSRRAKTRWPPLRKSRKVSCASRRRWIPGMACFPSLVRSFLKKYPQMNVELLVTNRVVDLVAEGVDLALRPGALDDSSLIARKLVSMELGLWASPAYIKKRGAPVIPRNWPNTNSCVSPRSAKGPLS